MQQVHELKILPVYFEAVLSGDKAFEIRYDKDRGFQKGDKVYLDEFDADKPTIDAHRFTGRRIRATISYVTAFEQKEGFVVFALTNVDLVIRNK